MKGGGLRYLAIVFAMVAATLTATFSVNLALATPEQSINPDTNQQQSSDQTSNETCEAGLSGFGWIFCPGQNLITTLIDGIMGWIDKSMNWTVLAGDSSSEIRVIWQRFLNLANIIFAIIFMVMIYSMATSTGLSNYDIKKILPRMIVVAIAVNISFYICAALVDVSNITGKGMYNLIYSQASQKPWNVINFALDSVASSALLVLALFLFGISVVVGLAVVLLALAFRQLALVVLVIVSPIAFALYLLPNTQKWGAKWTDWFIRLLFIYPMFTAVWGGARLVANIFETTGTSGLPSFLMNFMCAIAPALAIIPLFKASGGLLGMVTKSIDGNKQLSELKKKGNQAQRGLATNSQMANNLRRWGSGAAQGIQESLGDRRIVGGLVRGPGFNKLANYSANYDSKNDKAALDSGTNWVKNNLTREQTIEVMKTGGTYTDKAGRQHTLTDTHKLRAAYDVAKGAMDFQGWNEAIAGASKRAYQLRQAGRGVEANRVIDSLAEAMTSEKSTPLPNRAIGEFRKTGFGIDPRTNTWSQKQFDKDYAAGVMSYASGLTNEKQAKLSAGNRKTLQKQLYQIPNIYRDDQGNVSMTDEEKANYSKAVDTVKRTSEGALGNAKLMQDVNAASKASLEESSDLRTADEQINADDMNIDQIVNNFNSADRNNVIQSILAANRVKTDVNKFKNLRLKDQENINNIAALRNGGTYKPIPVASWTRDDDK